MQTNWMIKSRRTKYNIIFPQFANTHRSAQMKLGQVLCNHKPEVILDSTWMKKGFHFVRESLIKQKRLPKSDATWESSQEL